MAINRCSCVIAKYIPLGMSFAHCCWERTFDCLLPYRYYRQLLCQSSQKVTKLISKSVELWAPNNFCKKYIMIFLQLKKLWHENKGFFSL